MVGPGFEVRPVDLRGSARTVRGDAGDLAGAGAAAADAAESAGAASGVGPLAQSLSTLGVRVGEAVDAIARTLTRTADGMDASATDYVARDAGAGGLFRSVPLPGLGPAGP